MAPNAFLIGDVGLGERTSVWFGAVLRAELEKIELGAGSNVQDNCVLHTDMGFPLFVEENVTIGHGAIIHGAKISRNCLIGMGSILLNGSIIGENCIVAAGSLVTQGFEVPANSLLMGAPAIVKRKVLDSEIKHIQLNAEHYDNFRKAYLKN